MFTSQRLSTPAPEHKIYPYLLRNVRIERVNQVPNHALVKNRRHDAEAPLSQCYAQSSAA
ncbi:hypothetical protein CCAX7_25970 [Capsulimonas corticalis]|uniref:Uncharacterized protein n=1 Tax=Capsulimonas corticalis TaxID=2219043 RepID=A0A402CVV9_9BACT|nr:hypothetical protein CCAX7_25970 [Capsulimonas corticalis]